MRILAKNSKMLFVFFAFIFIIIALCFFLNNKNQSVLAQKKQPKYKYSNILRRTMHEFAEECSLMAPEQNLTKGILHSGIVSYYGESNRAKVDYWRNIDEIRFEYPPLFAHLAQYSNAYHPYCGNRLDCRICFGDGAWIEADLAGVGDPEFPDEKMTALSNKHDAEAPTKDDTMYHKYIQEIGTWSSAWRFSDTWLFFRNKEESLKWSHAEVDADPNASNYWGRGEAFEMNDDLAKAVEDYQTAWEYDPAYIYQVALARVYMKQGEREKSANAYCQAICDIDQRCDNGVMNYMRVFKYDLVKSRLLASPPYLEPCCIQKLQNISDLLDVSKEHLPEKEYLSAKATLFWTMELEKQGKLHEKLVLMPLCGFEPLVCNVPAHGVLPAPKQPVSEPITHRLSEHGQ